MIELFEPANESSNISRIGYDDVGGTLRVEFHSGSVFDYYEVPKEVFDLFLVAASPGKFHHKYVKPCFLFREIDQEQMDVDEQDVTLAKEEARL